MKKAIITSCSNKFFPSVLNLIGSIKKNYPEHPDIFVYDLGLFFTFKKQLEAVEGVHVVSIPHFVSFWRKNYTWKTYILNNPLAENNLYLDAGNEIRKDIDHIFQEIETNGYFCVEQQIPLENITPQEYKTLFDISTQYYQQNAIAAGIFGFSKNSLVQKTLSSLYDCGVSGLCLGFSEKELWRSKGVDKTNFVRNCPTFRHDTTILSLLMRKYFGEIKIHPSLSYGYHLKDEPTDPQVVIWNLRLSFDRLNNTILCQSKNKFFQTINNFAIYCFLIMKYINKKLKRLS